MFKVACQNKDDKTPHVIREVYLHAVSSGSIELRVRNTNNSYYCTILEIGQDGTVAPLGYIAGPIFGLKVDNCGYAVLPIKA